MLRMIALLLAMGALLQAPVRISLAASSDDSGDWWVKNYGALTAMDHPLAPRAEEIFQRVLAAADRKSSRDPKLVILRHVGEPWAISLKDGTVLLSQKALELCYANVDRETGDARTAFVLGHELAHLAKDDFWHKAAFESIQKHGKGAEADKELLAQLEKTADVQNTDQAREFAKTKELQADGYGILYASMAGYDPKKIVDGEGGNFFRDWVNQVAGETARSDPSHPSTEQRAALVRDAMESVVDDLDLFHFGVRLHQLGRDSDALALLEAFREKFPCREVFNNIGLINYQIAVKALAQCDPQRACRFKPATVLDTETRALEMQLVRGIDRGDCPQMETYRRHIQKAIQDFRAACEKDGYYVPARINLSSALIINGDFSGAMAALDEALKLKANDPGALTNRAVAMYELGPAIKVDMFEQATGVLREVLAGSPQYAEALYNMGRMVAERQRNAAARETWLAFLKVEPAGVYASEVREALDIADPPPETRKAASTGFAEPSPVKLGDFSAETRQQLAGLAVHPLKCGIVSGEYFSGKGIKVLALRDTVELVECPVQQKLDLSRLQSEYGPPRRVFAGASGTDTYLFDGFAVDVRDGIVIRATHFERVRI